MKKCSKCKLFKNLQEFGKSSQRHDKLNVYCRECFNRINRDYRKNNPTIWEIQKNKNFKKWREHLGISEDEVPRRRSAGSGYISRSGYLSYKKIGHPCADKNGRVHASHLVIYEKTGRILKNGETVHHKNGETLDNRFENLEIWRSGHPHGQRVEDKIAWCIEFLKEYGYSVVKKSSL